MISVNRINKDLIKNFTQTSKKQLIKHIEEKEKAKSTSPWAWERKFVKLCIQSLHRTIVELTHPQEANPISSDSTDVLGRHLLAVLQPDECLLLTVRHLFGLRHLSGFKWKIRIYNKSVQTTMRLKWTVWDILRHFETFWDI